MSDTFTNPGTSTGINWGDLNGRLLLFDVTGYETGINTSFGEKDAVRANITVLDGDAKGDGYNDSLVFGMVMISQLKSKQGEKVLGRLGQGEKKAGQNAPWKLAAPTEADKKVAREHLTQTTTPDTAPF